MYLPVVFDGVVPGHLTAIFEAEYLIQRHVRLYRPVGADKLLRRGSELLVEARQEIPQDLVGFAHGGGPRQA